MNNHNIFLILECVIVLFILYSFIKRFVGGSKNNETLYMSEKYIGIDTPIALHGYPDRVIKVNGSLRVDDFKTRNQFKVYDSDIWQISCYKYILRRTQKLPVLEESKVVIKSGKETKEFIIRLKSDEEIEKLYAKYIAIVNNDKTPALCNNKRFCAKCPYYRDKCFPNV